MLGVSFFAAFLCLGFGLANRVLAAERLPIRLLAGGVFGVLGSMWAIIPFAFGLGFTRLAHLLGLLLFSGCCLVARRVIGPAVPPNGDPSHRGSFLVPAVIAALLCALLTSHVIRPGEDGGLYVGQATFGDLSLHLGIITNLARLPHFPPEYSIFPGQRLSYPFLVDSLSSSLYLFGVPLRWAILVPSYVMALLLVLGLNLLFLELLRERRGALLAMVLFCFNGGFGFWYFVDKARADPNRFYRLFSAFYQTPTNLNEENIRWSNVLCDMLLPQRTTLAGWMALTLVLWLLVRAVDREETKYYALAGIVTGFLPMVHTHSFLAIGLLATAWFPVFFFQARQRRRHVAGWMWFGALALSLALPQVAYWTLRQAAGEGFSRFQLGWVNQVDFTTWFWLKNVGVVALLVFPALVAADRRLLSYYSGAAVLFVAANVYIFQPNEYDNNKLLYVWYLLTTGMVGSYLSTAYERLRGSPGTGLAAAILFLFATVSALLTLGREFASAGEFRLFSPAAVAAAKFVDAHTPADSLFVTADNHNNAVASLAGRRVYCGTPTFLNFHGLPYETRLHEVEAIYAGGPESSALATARGIDYLYFSDYERDRFKKNPSSFERRYPVVFRRGEVTIFAVSERAIGLARTARR